MAVLVRLSESDAKLYAGKWIAVSDQGTVVTSGTTATEVSDWLKDSGKSAELVYRVPAIDEPASYY